MVKYNIDTAEGEYQSGSGDRVLKNLLVISDVADMNEAETELLLKLYEYLFQLGNIYTDKLTVADILNWH